MNVLFIRTTQTCSLFVNLDSKCLQINDQYLKGVLCPQKCHVLEVAFRELHDDLTFS
jgi:hypothetical protein